MDFANSNGVSVGVSSYPTLGGSTWRIPSMDIPFSGTLDPRITFARNSTAQYFDSTGKSQLASANVARTDYNPSSLALNGLRVEGQRTNLCLYSTLANGGSIPTGWIQGVGTGLVTPVASNYGAADGAQAWSMTAAAQRPYFQQTFTFDVNTTYFFSLYLESVSGTLGLRDLLMYVSVLSAGATAQWYQDGVAVANTTQPVPGCIGLALTYGATGQTNAINIGLGGNGSVTGSCQISRPQLEVVTASEVFASSWIPTTSASATRLADDASMTGTNFSSWYNQSEGTLFADAISGYSRAAVQSVFNVIGPTTNDNCQIFRQNTPAVRAQVYAGGSALFNSINTAWPDATEAKVALAYKSANYAASINGSGPTTGSTAGAVATNINEAYIGSQTGGSYFNGWIKRITYYPTRLPDATVKAITT